MQYQNIREAIFLFRPNRFIAHIEIGGKKEICHIKNTGRCKELLLPGAAVLVQEVSSPKRKTNYDLIGVYKGNRLVNIDSQAPNQIFHEWVISSNLFHRIALIRPECKYQNSRFDFYIETCTSQIFVEVKGVTLEENGVALFPDAPTERGIKHITELCRAIDDGYEAYLFFIIQMKDVSYFSPNFKTHPAFAQALINAQKHGVKVMAIDCRVEPDFITAGDGVEIRTVR
jgi:sugar fermentation stimulation protein A